MTPPPRDLFGCQLCAGTGWRLDEPSVCRCDAGLQVRLIEWLTVSGPQEPRPTAWLADRTCRSVEDVRRALDAMQARGVVRGRLDTLYDVTDTYWEVVR